MSLEVSAVKRVRSLQEFEVVRVREVWASKNLIMLRESGVRRRLSFLAMRVVPQFQRLHEHLSDANCDLLCLEIRE